MIEEWHAAAGQKIYLKQKNQYHKYLQLFESLISND